MNPFTKPMNSMIRFYILMILWSGLTAVSQANVAFNWETSESSEPVAPNIKYSIFSCSSNGMLETDPEGEDGTAVEQLQTFDGAPMDSQQWLFEPTGDGYYLIKNACNGKVLDASPDGSWGVKVWDYAGIPWHHWRVIPMGYAKYKLQNRHTGKYLTISYWSSSLGMDIGQWDDSGWNDGQMFHLMFNLGDETKRFLIQSKACSDSGTSYVLDNLYANPNAGALIGQYSWWGGQNQQFYFESPSAYESTAIIRNGTAGGVLDADFDGNNGVELWPDYAGVPWQKWVIEHVNGPWFKIRNQHSGKILTMGYWANWSWSPSDQRATLCQYWDYNASAQQWRFEEVITE